MFLLLPHLSDRQILPILCAMDPEDLLNCGRASNRLRQLVSDREVWPVLLKKIPHFTNVKLEELVIFGSKGCPEMRQRL